MGELESLGVGWFSLHFTRHEAGTQDIYQRDPGMGRDPSCPHPQTQNHHQAAEHPRPGGVLVNPQDPSYTPTRAQLSPLFPMPMAEPLLLLQPQRLSVPCSSWPRAYIAFAPSSTWVLTAIVSTCNSRAGPQPAFQSPVRSREIISFPSGVQTEKEGFSAVFSASPSCPPRWLPTGPMYIITSAGYI